MHRENKEHATAHCIQEEHTNPAAHLDYFRNCGILSVNFYLKIPILGVEHS